MISDCRTNATCKTSTSIIGPQVQEGVVQSSSQLRRFEKEVRECGIADFADGKISCFCGTYLELKNVLILFKRHRIPVRRSRLD